jgi:hypothetical protein
VTGGSRARAVLVAAAAGTAALALGGAGEGSRGAARAAAGCPPQYADAAYTRRVRNVLRAGRDVWGELLLAARDGPTYEGVRRLLAPLFLAKGPRGRNLTDSGVHHVPFAQPLGPQGAGSVALHVADGSQVVSESSDGRRLTVRVGPLGRERFGSCRRRLGGPRLGDGYLPVLETEYADAAGVRYAQTSFAVRVPETRWLVSFVRVAADARAASRSAQIRFTPSTRRLRAAAGRLVRGPATHMFYSEGGRFDGSSVRYAVPAGGQGTALVAWLNYPARSRPLGLDEERFEALKGSVAAFWERRLAQGAQVAVPDQTVMDALRNLLVQNLTLTYRYSVGNQYEQFSFPEGVDVGQVIGEWGFAPVGAAIMRTSLTRRPTPYPNWKMGEKLLGWARYHELTRQRAPIERATPVLSRYVTILGRQIARSPRGLLARERYSSDIPDQVYGLHSQAVVWQGLLAMGRTWAQTGHPRLAARCRALAVRLERGLRRAVAESQRRLPDGSLFVPVKLLDGEGPYRAVTESRPGSYWNLVSPYAFASGLFAPGGAQARGILRYLLRHGSRFLGLVRAGAFGLYGRDRVFPTSGINQVYGINAARFFAANDQADQLVLSLYGQLGAGMTPGTFVAGEGGTVEPLARAFHRAAYLPPNSASNAAFLTALRLMLVHETRDRRGSVEGLRLAFATARPWLRPGRRIEVRRLPTAFGPVSYALESAEGSVRGAVDVPARPLPRRLVLRLRLPRPARIVSVTVNGRPHSRFNRRAETIDLSGLEGRLELQVGVG